MNKKHLENFVRTAMATLTVALVYHCKNPKIESDYFSPEAIADRFDGNEFAGSESCMECHAEFYAEHLNTAHYNTSAIADSTNIEGSFKEGSNTLDLESVVFTMISKDSSRYQRIQIKNRHIEVLPKKMDIVIGSGVRGQTYGTWEGNALFQLQPSYYSPTDSWVNSPGYPQYYLERPIRDACLKCHVSFAENIHTSTSQDRPVKKNRFNKQAMIYGIDCEKCHRPASRHVEYHRKNPNREAAFHILVLDSLSRQQRLDVCAQCHSGSRGQILKGNSFSFMAGDILEQHSQNVNSGKTNLDPDVHGNQYGLLTKSECFKQTATMDCSTCHNPHKNQRGELSYFNQKCSECHGGNAIECSKETTAMQAMDHNCVACHMPLSPSESMKVQLSSSDSTQTAVYIRNHLIGIYENEEL